LRGKNESGLGSVRRKGEKKGGKKKIFRAQLDDPERQGGAPVSSRLFRSRREKRERAENVFFESKTIPLMAPERGDRRVGPQNPARTGGKKLEVIAYLAPAFYDKGGKKGVSENSKTKKKLLASACRGVTPPY